MKTAWLLGMGLLFAACQDAPSPNSDTKLSDSLGMISSATPVDSLLPPPANTVENNIEADSMEAVDPNPDIETYYIVVADTGMQYASLNTKMYGLSAKLKQAVDTLNRGFDAKKNKIVLSENDDDELYAGEYFPRRFPSTTLSLEYMDSYTPGSKEGMMGLITGIYEKQTEAEAALQLVKAHAPSARVVKADIYVGCIH